MISKTKLMVYGAIIILALIAFDVMRRKSQKDDAMSDHADTHVTSGMQTGNVQLNGFSAEDFKVLLPEMPKHASEAVPLPSGQGLIKYDMYLSQKKDGTTYMVSEIQYPKGFAIPQPADLLESVMKEMMSGNANNQLKNMQKGTFQGYPSVDFEISNNQVHVKSKAFIADKTLFVLTLIDKDLEEMNKQFDNFVNSFEVQNKLPSVVSDMAPQGTPQGATAPAQPAMTSPSST